MNITAKFPRMCTSIVTIFFGLLSTPLLSMENNNREDFGLSTLRDNSFMARVVEVVSGDTIKIQRTGSSSNFIEQIRLDGIRAPKMDTCLGLSAQKFLENMILEKVVLIKDCTSSCNEVSFSSEIQAKIYMNEICINFALVYERFVWANPIEGLGDGGRAPQDRIGRRTSFRMEYPKNPIKRVSSQEQFLIEESHK